MDINKLAEHDDDLQSSSSESGSLNEDRDRTQSNEYASHSDQVGENVEGDGENDGYNHSNKKANSKSKQDRDLEKTLMNE